MKKCLLFLLIPFILAACSNRTPADSGEGGDGGELGIGTFVTVDFTQTHTIVDEVPTTGDTKSTNFVNTLKNYYFTDENIALSSIDGGYLQINVNFQVTETRTYGQLLFLGGRRDAVDFTFTFVNTIKSVTFVCEPYSKYIPHTSAYNNDLPTYLKVNDVKKDIAPHSQEDKDERTQLKYTVNSKTMHLEAPNENPDNELTQGNRILVYQMMLEY